jgi:magnesium-protoporphyrin O-methyltransferase
VAVDIAPQLIDIAAARLPATLVPRVTFRAGDMTDAALGRFDFVMAMDSLIYYRTPDIAAVLDGFGGRTRGGVIFTVAPKTAFLMAFFAAGKLFPRKDRSPTMVPQALGALQKATGGRVHKIARVSRGFYISECLEFRP